MHKYLKDKLWDLYMKANCFPIKKGEIVKQGWKSFLFYSILSILNFQTFVGSVIRYTKIQK